jgi:putative transposase
VHSSQASQSPREPIVRLILDGTAVRVRLDRKATSISLLVVIGVRADGQKVLLAIKSMGGESAEAWRTVLYDLITRGLRRPEFLIVDGAPGLEKAIPPAGTAMTPLEN